MARGRAGWLWVVPVCLVVLILVITMGYWRRGKPAYRDSEIFQGIRFQRKLATSPRAVTLNILYIDLTRPGISFEFTKGYEGRFAFKAQKTSTFLKRTSCQVAINASYFWPFWSRHPLDFYPHHGDRVTVVGSYVSAGHEFGKVSPRYPSLYFDDAGKPTFRVLKHPTADISGKLMVLQNGKIPEDSQLEKGQPDCQPRTSVGLSKDEKQMIILVADGRQPGRNEGLSLAELGQVMKSLGAEDALSLNGEGSETMVSQGANGQTTFLNEPVDLYIPGRERVVATHLGIHARPLNP